MYLTLQLILNYYIQSLNCTHQYPFVVYSTNKCYYQSQYFQKSSRLPYFFIESKELFSKLVVLTPTTTYSCFETDYQTGCAFYVFLHPQHLHDQEHPTPELKHSQYLLRQFDFLQLHLLSAKLRFLSPPSFVAVLACIISSLKSSLFLQPTQAQSSPHSLPVEKHSQYIFRQKVFLQVHPIFFFLAELVLVGTKDILSASESSSSWGLGYIGNYMFYSEAKLGKTFSVLIIFKLWLRSGSLSMEGKLKKEFLADLGCIQLCCIIILIITTFHHQPTLSIKMTVLQSATTIYLVHIPFILQQKSEREE